MTKNDNNIKQQGLPLTWDQTPEVPPVLKKVEMADDLADFQPPQRERKPKEEKIQSDTIDDTSLSISNAAEPETKPVEDELLTINNAEEELVSDDTEVLDSDLQLAAETEVIDTELHPGEETEVVVNNDIDLTQSETGTSNEPESILQATDLDMQPQTNEEGLTIDSEEPVNITDEETPLSDEQTGFKLVQEESVTEEEKSPEIIEEPASIEPEQAPEEEVQPVAIEEKQEDTFKLEAPAAPMVEMQPDPALADSLEDDFQPRRRRRPRKESSTQETAAKQPVKDEEPPGQSDHPHDKTDPFKFDATFSKPRPQGQSEEEFPEEPTIPSTGGDQDFSNGSFVTVTRADGTIGQKLAEGRRIARMSISQTEETTRIRRDLIEALEQDNHEKLPAPVYTRSYIRKLSQLYGMNTDVLVDQYDNLLLKDRKANPISKPVADQKVIDDFDSDYSESVINPQFIDHSDTSHNLKRIVIILIAILASTLVIKLLSNEETEDKTDVMAVEKMVEPKLKMLNLLEYSDSPKIKAEELKVPDTPL